jgi:23S rRNA pseudouridine2605 synthase
MGNDQNPESAEPEFEAAEEIAAEDAIGASADPGVGAGLASEPAAGVDAPTEAAAENPLRRPDSEDAESEFDPGEHPAPKLDRLQKILAQAGVASRRHAEKLITEGRVQVNGQVVTTLGSKADAVRDHIRVDGKLLRGAERPRYFILNKPKGFVTTAKDPEGRPTVMQFFEKMHERLYPVGRLDYQSEGLLLVTNDGELANKLTRAASGVEKTYLVKVSGQPTEAELDILRGGIAIDRGQPGSGKVNTAPARVRQVRQGDNPWYEVIIIEGRNRELRKMFQEIGHFVEKIRRVGYGPLVLDIEPGNIRELEPAELAALRKAAEGKGRAPKSKEMRLRHAADAAQLPTVDPRPSPPRLARSFPAVKPFAKPVQERAASSRPSEFRPKKSFGGDRPSRAPRPAFSSGPSKESFRPAAGAGPAKLGSGRPGFRIDDRSSRPAGQPPARFAPGSTGAARSGGDKTAIRGPVPAKPAWKNSGSKDRPPYKRPAAPYSDAAPPGASFSGPKPPRLQIERVQHVERAGRSNYDRSGPARPLPGKARTDRPGSGHTGQGRSDSGRSKFGASNRPFRSGEGGLSRPFTTSSGKPRAGGARPSNKSGKPYKPAGRSYGAGPKAGSASGGRPATGPVQRPFRSHHTPPGGASESGPRSAKSFTGSSAGPSSRWGGAKSGSGWKPRPSFGGKSEPGSSGSSRPAPKNVARRPGGKPFHPPSEGKRTGPPRRRHP